MFTTYHNPSTPNHNTSQLSKDKHLKSGTGNYLLKYNNQVYIIKSQEDYWNDVFHIHSIRNMTTNKRVPPIKIATRARIERLFVRTLEKLFSKRFRTHTYPYFKRNEEWDVHVLPKIKQHITSHISL